MWLRWYVKDQTTLDALLPTGIVQNWPVSSLKMGWSKAFLQKRSALSCSHISSNHGDIIFGSRPRLLATTTLPAQVHEIVDLYTRPLSEQEIVLCVDEKTNLQPRPRNTSTL